MKCIPGGEFRMGYTGATIEEDTGKPIHDTEPEHVVALDAYYMDTYEVTSSQYQECVKAGGCSADGHPNYQGYSRPDQPMVGVNWFHARDFCRWKGKRLPTEAEWEKAARGPEGEVFPWGNAPIDCSRAIIQENGKKGCGTGTTVEVGSRPVGRYGLYDMAGNSWEWVQDWYSPSYGECGADCQGKNPKGPCGGAESCPGHDRKIVRGGSWWWDGPFATGYNRRAHFPLNKPFHHYGFRCAADG